MNQEENTKKTRRWNVLYLIELLICIQPFINRIAPTGAYLDFSKLYYFLIIFFLIINTVRIWALINSPRLQPGDVKSFIIVSSILVLMGPCYALKLEGEKGLIVKTQQQELAEQMGDALTPFYSGPGTEAEKEVQRIRYRFVDNYTNPRQTRMDSNEPVCPKTVNSFVTPDLQFIVLTCIRWSGIPISYQLYVGPGWASKPSASVLSSLSHLENQRVYTYKIANPELSVKAHYYDEKTGHLYVVFTESPDRILLTTEDILKQTPGYIK